MNHLLRLLVASAIAASLTSSALADDDQPDSKSGLPNTSQAVKGALGGVGGGLVGSQVGGGRGNTAATAVGAGVGAVAASGCKPTIGSAIAGFVGGLLGSQVADSRTGKNVGAGAGAAAGALLLADCSSEDKPEAKAKSVSKTPAGMNLSVNGMRLTTGGSYRTGFEGLPPVKTMADFQALDRLVKFYLNQRNMALNAGDFDAAVVAHHIAVRLAQYQSTIATSSVLMGMAMQGNTNGSVQVAAGSYAVIPTFQRGGAPAPVIANFGYEPMNSLAANRYGEATQVAANDLSSLNGQLPNARDGLRRLGSIPEGTPVTLQNGLVIERTGDSFVVFNGGRAPTPVALGDLGYLPPIKLPSEFRQQAGQIMINLSKSAEQVFLRQPYTKDTWIAAPNQVTLYGRPEAAVDVNGRLANGAMQASESAQAYKNRNSAFRFAMDTAIDINGSTYRRDFFNTCLNSGNGTAQQSITGQYGEIVVLGCSSQTHSVAGDVYQKQFYIGENGLMQTWASLAKDKGVAEELKKSDEDRETFENFIQLFPVVGNVESAMQCMNTQTVTHRVSNIIAAAAGSRQSVLEGSRDFVASQYNANDPSWGLSRSLSCLSVIPVGNTVIKLAKNGKTLKAGAEAATGKLAPMLNAFDTDLFGAGKNLQNVTAAIGQGNMSQSATALTKGLYDGLQQYNTFSQLADSISNVGVMVTQ